MVCFTINSRHLTNHVTDFLGQNYSRSSTAKLSSGRVEWVHDLPDPLKSGVLNLSHVPEIKHKRAVAPGVSTPWAQNS